RGIIRRIPPRQRSRTIKRDQTTSGSMSANSNSFNTRAILDVEGAKLHYHSLPALGRSGIGDVERLPYAHKVLLENLLRHEDNVTIGVADIEAFMNWDHRTAPEQEIFFMPARVLLQDFTGVPAVADLAAMRAAIQRMGGDPARINPFTHADLVID